MAVSLDDDRGRVMKQPIEDGGGQDLVNEKLALVGNALVTETRSGVGDETSVRPASAQGVTANRNPLIYWSGRPESNRRPPAWEFSWGPSRTLTPSHSSSLSRPPARDASHDFSPLLTRSSILGSTACPNR